MTTVIRDPAPPEVRALIERRRRQGQDLYDEVWAGVLHMNPAPDGAHGQIDGQLQELLGPLARGAGFTTTGPFNLGDAEDYRVPDRGLHRDWADAVWYPTVALAIEIVAPDDETWAKLPFYAAHAVDEVLVVDPASRSVELLVLDGGSYAPSTRSALLDLDVEDLLGRIDWPA
jgi:hypothetical protein